MPTYTKRFINGLVMVAFLMACCTVPLLSGCESAEEKRQKEIKEYEKKFFAPRKEKLDPHKATGGPIH